MTGRLGFDGGQEQIRDWVHLMDAIEAAPEVVPCTNFPDAYFPNGDEPELARMAKASCDTCPVAMTCLRYGTKWDMEGIWGGKSKSERKAIRDRQREAA